MQHSLAMYKVINCPSSRKRSYRAAALEMLVSLNSAVGKSYEECIQLYFQVPKRRPVNVIPVTMVIDRKGVRSGFDLV